VVQIIVNANANTTLNDYW